MPKTIEIERALVCWIVAEQDSLRQRTEFEQMKHSLNFFTSEHDILRLRGRFGSTDWDEDVKHPIIIGSLERRFMILLVRHGHQRVMHSGVETTLNWIRRRFWIVKARKTVLNKCVVCKRFNARTLSPPETPDLPKFRVDNSFSFCNIGVDFCGPLLVRSLAKDSTFKVHILLVTCASSRALHLELVPDLTSSTFIRGFLRFVSRKGLPKLMVSDNAKTFRSVEVKRFMTSHGITQRFILPATPWWGGFYERLVRFVKLSLRKALRKSYLRYEELETVICQVEAVINSRPLTYISADDLSESLTPFHLIYGRNVSLPPANVVTEMPPENVSRRYEHLKEYFGKRNGNCLVLLILTSFNNNTCIVLHTRQNRSHPTSGMSSLFVMIRPYLDKNGVSVGSKNSSWVETDTHGVSSSSVLVMVPGTYAIVCCKR